MPFFKLRQSAENHSLYYLAPTGRIACLAQGSPPRADLIEPRGVGLQDLRDASRFTEVTEAPAWAVTQAQIILFTAWRNQNKS